MQDLKDYIEYQQLFKDDLVTIVRKVLNKVADNSGYDFEDSPEHNALSEYFNKFDLHKKMSKEEFERQK